MDAKRWFFWRWARFRFRRRVRIERRLRDEIARSAADHRRGVAELTWDCDELTRKLAIASAEVKALTEIVARDRERIAFETAHFSASIALAGEKNERH